MSNQNHAVQIVVRAKDGQVRAGFASQYPKREGWTDVATYGRWFGSQMSYRPFQRALEAAKAEARRLNGDEEPPDLSDALCPCGDVDCSRPFGHDDEAQS